jgi:putative phosphoesterase
VIGLIADTHVPDRMRRLNPKILDIFQKANVNQILHAGDISVPRVLRELQEVAPVLAVRGNRDWFGFQDLPMQRIVEVGATRIGMTHGHGSWGLYFRDKLRYFVRGPQKFEFFMNRAMRLVEEVDVLVFGHNHDPLVKDVDGLLVVNPGSACCQAFNLKPPSVALLRIDGDKVRAEIAFL